MSQSVRIKGGKGPGCCPAATTNAGPALYQLQRVDEFMNVGKVTTEHLYQGENTDFGEKDARQANAGEVGDSNSPTSQFDVFVWWIRLPIDDATGEWKPDEQIPHWYQTVWVGDLDGKNICVKCATREMGE